MAQLIEKTYHTVCKYLWEVVGIENIESTILSSMIKIKGVESFRVGLKNKNQVPPSTLLLLTTNLNKMGLKVEAVTYDSVGWEEYKKIMKPCSINAEDEMDSGCLQLFTAQLNGFATGNHSFVFQVYLAGVVQDYRAQEVDLLLRSVQQFLKFIYAGELEGPIKSQHLMQLAVTYKIKTLKDLCYSCQAASHEIDEEQMASSESSLRPG